MPPTHLLNFLKLKGTSSVIPTLIWVSRIIKPIIITIICLLKNSNTKLLKSLNWNSNFRWALRIQLFYYKWMINSTLLLLLYERQPFLTLPASYWEIRIMTDHVESRKIDQLITTTAKFGTLIHLWCMTEWDTIILQQASPFKCIIWLFSSWIENEEVWIRNILFHIKISESVFWTLNIL